MRQDFSDLKARVETPALLIDADYIQGILSRLDELRRRSDCRVLFSVKSLPLESVIEQVAKQVDGFSVSSLFETRLVKQLTVDHTPLHLTTPGLRSDDMAELAASCRCISFNSLSQFERMAGALPATCSPGLRVNPGVSFSDDRRYDPCRKQSKLGAPLDAVVNHWPKACRGLHFHTVFNQSGFSALLATVAVLEERLGEHLYQLDWLNLGGGYLFDQTIDITPLVELVRRLRAQYGLEIYIEPGKAVVGKAGYLISSVIDQFVSDGAAVAVVDTSINHNPELFEYQRAAHAIEHDEQGAYAVQVAGSTCLAGDIIGQYRFNRPLELGDRLVFADVGAYSLIKANRFNGYNLPAIYRLQGQNLALIKRYNFQHYRQQWLSD